MPLADSGCEVIEPLELRSAQLDAVGGRIFFHAGNALGAGNGCDVVALRDQPGQSDLCRRCANLGSNGLDLVNDAKLAVSSIVASFSANSVELTRAIDALRGYA